MRVMDCNDMTHVMDYKDMTRVMDCNDMTRVIGDSFMGGPGCSVVSHSLFRGEMCMRAACEVWQVRGAAFGVLATMYVRPRTRALVHHEGGKEQNAAEGKANGKLRRRKQKLRLLCGHA